MQNILLFIHVVVAISIIGLVLLQPGQGAHAGSSFGAGGAQSVFGSKGSGGFLSKLTTYLAIAFFAISLLLAHLNAKSVNKDSILQEESIEIPVPEPVTQQPVGDVPSVPIKTD